MVVSTEPSKDCKNVSNYKKQARERNGDTENLISARVGGEKDDEKQQKGALCICENLTEESTARLCEVSFYLIQLELKTRQK